MTVTKKATPAKTVAKKAPAKAAAKRVVKPKAPKLNHVVIIRTELVELKLLRPYYKNPNVGDVDAVAKSLEENGMYRSIVVNMGGKTGRKNEVLAGNTTFLAAKNKLNWTKIQVGWVDVDEEGARRIVLNDNKTRDKASYDNDILAGLLREQQAATGTLDGTGWVDTELADLLEELSDLGGLSASLSESLGRSDSMFQPPEPGNEVGGGSNGGSDELGDQELDPLTGEAVEEYEDSEDEEEQVGIEEGPTDLPGMFALKSSDEIRFDGSGYFGIPKLDPKKFMTFEDIPEKLKTWAGFYTKDDEEPDRWWLFNWGSEKTKYMKDRSKVVIGFYANDEVFEDWWWYPEDKLGLVLNTGIKYMLTPNFSMYGDHPHAMHLWSLYRSRWIGRYCQDAGIKVMPDVQWPMNDITFLEKYVIPTLPKGLPCISVQIQTFDPKDKQWISQMRDGFQAMFEQLDPKGMLVYCGRPGRDFFETLGYPGKVRFIDNRLFEIGKTKKPREKRVTI